MNKIMIKGKLAFNVFRINIIYLLFTFISQYLYIKPVYVDNLNWTCSTNISYLWNKDSKKVKQTFLTSTCKQGEYDSKYECDHLSSSYYCE